jgi:RNA polymerase sigma factor (TIGR02999 family)
VPQASPDITDLLLRWNSGDRRAFDDLTAAVYDELRRLASALLFRERTGHTLSSTALVHEAYLRLVDQHRVKWENRAHFFGAASHIMRRVLVDHAKKKSAAKRGGSTPVLAIEEYSGSIDPAGVDLLWLNEAMDRLEEVDPRKVRTVEMKVFGGMTNQEIAAALDVSDATVERDWKFARAWLIQALKPGRQDQSRAEA